MNNNQPLVSVVTPFYNAVPDMHRALESIINQTYKNLEIICVDDASKDDTLKILNEYAQKDLRIKVISNKTNVNHGQSRNFGIEIANGKYIVNMDADDVSNPRRVEKSVRFLEENTDIDIVSVGVCFLNEKGKFLYNRATSSTLPVSIYYNMFLTNVLGNGQITCKTEVLRETKYSSTEITGPIDYELWPRVLRKGRKSAIMEEVLYSIYLTTESYSRNPQRIENHEKATISFINKDMNIYLNEEIPFIYSGIIGNKMRFIDFTYNDLKNSLKLLDRFTQTFILREHPNSKELTEIKDAKHLQLIDIHIQSLKHLKSTIEKVKIGLRLTPLLLMSIFNKKRRNFLTSKVSKKIKQ